LDMGKGTTEWERKYNGMGKDYKMEGKDKMI
jgi:hypothetical protein